VAAIALTFQNPLQPIKITINKMFPSKGEEGGRFSEGASDLRAPRRPDGRNQTAFCPPVGVSAQGLQ